MFSWQELARCRGYDTSYFFLDEKGNHSKTAFRALCDSCPVKQMCLEDAIVYDAYGVWGGLTHIERRAKYGDSYRKAIIEELEEMGEYVHLYGTAE